MSTIEEQLYNVDWQNADQVIEFYEANQLYFDNYDFLNNKNKISEFIDIKLHYVNSLCEKHYYKKALVVLDQINELLQKIGENHWNFRKATLFRKFLLGMTYSRMNKNKEAYPIFTQLVKEDPEHYYYKLWQAHTRLGTYNWLFNTLGISGGALFFINEIFSLDDIIGIPIGLVGLFTLFAAFFTQKIIKIILEKKINRLNSLK